MSWRVLALFRVVASVSVLLSIFFPEHDTPLMLFAIYLLLVVMDVKEKK